MKSHRRKNNFKKTFCALSSIVIINPSINMEIISYMEIITAAQKVTRHGHNMCSHFHIRIVNILLSFKIGKR
jgi:hypothetical protein